MTENEQYEIHDIDKKCIQLKILGMTSVNEKLPNNDYPDGNYHGYNLKEYKFPVLIKTNFSTSVKYHSYFNFKTGKWVITERNPNFIVTHLEIPLILA